MCGALESRKAVVLRLLFFKSSFKFPEEGARHGQKPQRRKKDWVCEKVLKGGDILL